MPEAQNYKNHGRIDPPFHFFILVVLVANVISSLIAAYRNWHFHPLNSAWQVVFALALLVLAFKVRTYPLAAQDRVIRLEERLRYAALLSPAEVAKAGSLNPRQIVALRFASDAELPTLIERTLAENLVPKQIKQSIVSWRADYDRV